MLDIASSFARAASGSPSLEAESSARGRVRLGHASELLAVSGFLLLPLIGAVLLSHGLRDHLTTFHSRDEYEYHLPIIRDFTASFPRMNLSDYNSATTPLFHVVEALIAKLFGPSMPVLRAVNVAATFAIGLSVFSVFRFVLAASAVTAALLALTFMVSPYVFGAGFVLLTDNLALALAIAALAFTLRSLRSDDPAAYATAALLASLAVLTRQLYIWLLPLLVVFAVVGRPRIRAMQNGLHALLLCALAASPYAILCVAWGGTNPPAFQYFRGLNPSAMPFMLACIGLYALPFLLINQLSATTGHSIDWLGTMLLGMASALILLVAPLTPIAIDPTLSSDGYLWRASNKFPSLARSSIVFWVLVPLGLATLALDGRRKGIRAVGLWVFIASLPLLIFNISPFQKYYDPLALMIVFLVFFGSPAAVPEAPARWVLITFAFLFGAYFLRNVLT